MSTPKAVAAARATRPTHPWFGWLRATSNRWWSAPVPKKGRPHKSPLTDPGNGNRYVYAADNPINSADPTGRGILGDVFAVAGAVATIAGIAAALTPPGLVVDALVATSIVVGEPATVGGLVCAFDSSASC